MSTRKRFTPVGFRGRLSGRRAIMAGMAERTRVAAVIVRSSQVLMVRERARGPTGRHDGAEYWVLPGGGVEPGESAEAALMREVREEVGLTGLTARYLFDAVHPAGVTACYAVDVPFDEEPRLGTDELPCDCPRMVGLAWVPLPALSSDTSGTAVPATLHAAVPALRGVFPKKRVAAGALFFNGDGEMLIVKGAYGERRWGVVGGVIEAGESPRDGCMREVREEIGLDLPIGRMLVVDHTSADARSDDSLQLLFDGGVLDFAHIARIRLQAEELTEHRFVPPAEALRLIGGKLGQRLPAALRARADGLTLYLENGEPVG
jgi:8-oxo-dGTP diphosphatase